MRRQREVGCLRCGAVWRQASARFCGSCGAVLGAPLAAAPAAGRRVRRGIGRRPLAAVAAALVVGAAATGLEAVRSTGSDAETGVSLPGQDEVAGNQGPSRQEAADALAMFDERRLGCLPDGCERWRRPVAEAWGRVAVVDGQLFAIEDGDLVAIDPVTGDDRWRHRVEGVVHGAGTGEATPWKPMPGQLQLVEGGEGLLLHDNRGVWQLRDPSTGRVRWTTTTPLRDAWWQSEVDGLLMLAADGRVGSPRVAALDLATGAVLWSRTLDGGNFWQVGPTGIVIERDEMLEVLAPATGEIAFAVPYAPGSWLESLGPWLVLHEVGSGPLLEHVTRLLDPADGSVAVELSGSLGYPYLDADGRLVAFLMPDERSVGPFSVVAVDADGSIAWENPFDGQLLRHACCADISLQGDDAVRVRLPDNGPTLVLDLRTGEVRDDLGVTELPDDVWWENGLGHAWDDDGGGVVLHDGQGAQIRVSGEGWPIMSDPLVLMSGFELVGVQFVTG